jgi:hypothetical protein
MFALHTRLHGVTIEKGTILIFTVVRSSCFLLHKFASISLTPCLKQLLLYVLHSVNVKNSVLPTLYIYGFVTIISVSGYYYPSGIN